MIFPLIKFELKRSSIEYHVKTGQSEGRKMPLRANGNSVQTTKLLKAREDAGKCRQPSRD